MGRRCARVWGEVSYGELQKWAQRAALLCGGADYLYTHGRTESAVLCVPGGDTARVRACAGTALLRFASAAAGRHPAALSWGRILPTLLSCLGRYKRWPLFMLMLCMCVSA